MSRTPTRTATRPASPAAPHAGSTTLLALVLPTALVGGCAAVALGWRGELPDPVAVHWGPDGADGFAALEAFVAATVGGVVGGALLLGLLTRRVGRQAMVRRVLHGTAVWLSVLLGGLLVTTLDAQRGLADASAAQVGDAATAGTLLVATAAAGLVARLTPGDDPRPATAPIPADAPRLPLADGEQAVWVSDVGRGTALPLAGAALLLAAVVGATSGLWLFAGALALGLTLLLTALLRWTVTVDATGLTARSGLRRPGIHVPIDEVERADVVDVDPLREFGGWGLRLGRDGRTGVVLGRGPAIEVHRGGGRVVVVTTPDAGTGAALLNTLAARRRDETSDREAAPRP